MSGPDLNLRGSNPLRPPFSFFNFQLGAAIIAVDSFTPPNFETGEINDRGTIENTYAAKLHASYQKFLLNIAVDYSHRVSGAENPYFPNGWRPYELNAGARNLDGHFDFLLGRFFKRLGRAYGVLDGADVILHSQDGTFSLNFFAGFLPDPLTLAVGKRVGWGKIIVAELWQTRLKLNFFQVYDEAGERVRERLGGGFTNQSRPDLEIRGLFEYDTLKQTLVKLMLGADYQISRGWRGGFDLSRTDPTFEPRSFFNTFPHYPYWQVGPRLEYAGKKIKWDFAFNLTKFESDSIVSAGTNAQLFGFNLGGLFSRGSNGSDPYLDYFEVHSGYSRTLARDRLRLGIDGSIFRYNRDRLEGVAAYQASARLRWRIAGNLVLDGSGTVQRNADHNFRPFFSVGVAYYFFKAFGE